MSFTWPDIPFQGSEVTAFAAAYKELAEHILDDYFNAPIGPLQHMEAPYRSKLVVKELLQEGLFYACFIIQQRSGTSGPGTDFVLGNSPINISDPDLAPEIIRRLGCKWGDFEASFQSSMKCSPPEPEPTPIEPDRCCEDGANPLEGATINTINTLMWGNPWRNMLSDLLNRYLNCQTDVFTASDVDSGDLEKMKEDLQKIIDRKDIIWHDNGYAGGNKVMDITNEFSSSKLASLGATKVYKVSTYGNRSHYVVGYVNVTVDQNDKVLCMRDDYDFAYGWEMNRSDGSKAGDPFTFKQPGHETVDENGDPLTAEEVCARKAMDGISCKGRDLPINSFYSCNGGGHNGGGRGAPVPINICF